MVTEVRHGTRSGTIRLGGSAANSASNRLNEVGVLANMYQRIPANVLYKMEAKNVLNFAILIGDPLPATRGFKSNPCTHWQTHALLGHESLTRALRRVEEVNQSTKYLEKVKINFADGYCVTLARENPINPGTLRFATEYDPSEKFVATTASKAAASRSILQKKLQFVSDDRGRSLSLRPTSSKSNRPTSPLGVTTPQPGSVGFTFTPVSTLSFAMRPNSIVPGCRPSIRNTNPQAIHYRPRALTRPLSPSVAEHADGLILNQCHNIDYRNSMTPKLQSVPRQRPSTAQ